jgi:hypothetical protein
MKTLAKHIEIKFDIRYLGLDDFTLELSTGIKRSFDSNIYVAEGILIGSLDNIFSQQIIFFN